MNKKHIFIGIGIIISFIVIIGLIYFFIKSKITYTTLKSIDEKFSIELPSNIEYKTNLKEGNNFTIDLYSVKDEMYMYATSIEKTHELDLLEIVKDDKVSYTADKENIAEDTGISEINIKDYKAYEYSLKYYDKEYGKDFYSNIVWIETSNNIYILNFEVVSNNADKYKDIFVNIKNSFVEL